MAAPATSYFHRRFPKNRAVEVWSHMHVGDGIELHIEPRRAGLSPEQVRALFKEVMNLAKKIREEEP